LFDKLKKNIFYIVGYATLIYFILLVFSDFDLVLTALYNFPFTTILIVQIVIIISLILKFIRWHSYLINLNIKITLIDSVFIFTSGLIMSISPGKIGELLKAYLIKNKYQVSFSKTSSIIFAERIIEFIALIIIAFAGVFLYEFGYQYIVIPIIVIGLLFFIVSSKNIVSIIFSLLTKITYFKNKINNLSMMHSSLVRLFETKLFLKMLILSIAAWLLECFGFYIILSSFAIDVKVMWSAFVYSIAIIFGAISMLPGGLGATEGSLTYLLSQNSIAENIAIVSTILIRIVTLWFSVLIGFIAYFIFVKKIRQNSMNI